VIMLAPSAEVSGYDLVPKVVRRSKALGPTARTMYQEVLSFIQASKLGCCSASVKTLGRAIDRCERTARYALKELLDIGLLRATPRTTTTTLLWAEPLTLELVIKLQPTYVTSTCWAALWAKHRTDPWVSEHCPDTIRTQAAADTLDATANTADVPARGAATGCRPYKYKYYEFLPQKTTSSSAGRGEGHAKHEQESKIMDPRPRSKATFRAALSDPGYREKQARQVARRSEKMANKIRNVQPVLITDPTDISDAHKWSSQDFVRMVRAASLAGGVNAWCTRKNPTGKFSTYISGSNREMNKLLELLDASGVSDKRRQARLLLLWIQHWSDFVKVQPSAERVGFEPRYWAAAWVRVWPWLRNLSGFDSEFQAAAPGVTPEAADSIMAQIRALYLDWPERDDIDALAVELLNRRVFENEREFRNIVWQRRYEPTYAELWDVVRTRQKA